MKPYQDITFAGVAWNEAERAPALLELAKRWFSHTVIAVQKSTDSTLAIVRRILNRETDRVLEHPWYGSGDPSLSGVVRAVLTPWTFVVSFDEMPDSALLKSLELALEQSQRTGADAYWIRFESTIEGLPAQDSQSGHLRLFRTDLGWPKAKLHSRPEGKNEKQWPVGRIKHDRSLDEMMLDYLRNYQIGISQPSWEEHNRLMMHDACAAVAARYGWDRVTAHDWWPQVKAIAFAGEEIP